MKLTCMYKMFVLYKEIKFKANHLGFKALLQSTNFTLGPDATLNTEMHKHSVRIMPPYSVNAS